MKKRLLLNIVSIILVIALATSTAYAWWLTGNFGKGLSIRSAKISSKITVEKGQDYNFDGNLDVDQNGAEIFHEVDVTDKGEEQILVLNFENIIPTEIHTWRITVENKGDAAGYVYATLFEEIDLTDDISQEEELIKYMSISTIVSDPNGNDVVNKIYFYNINSDQVLFGGTDDDIVESSKSIQIVFQIQLEAFDDLVLNGICTEDDREEYFNLQGKTISESFKFLDVSLSTEQP